MSEFPKSRAEVYRKASLIVERIEEWHEENEDFEKIKDATITYEQKEKLPEELRSLYEEMEEFLDEVAAHPDYQECLVPWVIEVSGDEGIHTTEEEVEEQGLEKFLDSIGGMYGCVSDWFKKVGAQINERCISKQGWSLGIICSEDIANSYCRQLYDKFEHLIEDDVLTVRKIFYCNRLAGLTSENYKKFIEMESDDVIEFQVDEELKRFLFEGHDDDYDDDDEDDDEDFMEFEVELEDLDDDDDDDDEETPDEEEDEEEDFI